MIENTVTLREHFLNKSKLAVMGAMAGAALSLAGCGNEQEPQVTVVPETEATANMEQSAPLSASPEVDTSVCLDEEGVYELIDNAYNQPPVATEEVTVKDFACDGTYTAVHFGDDIMPDNVYTFRYTNDQWANIGNNEGADAAPCSEVSREVADVLNCAQ